MAPVKKFPTRIQIRAVFRKLTKKLGEPEDFKLPDRFYPIREVFTNLTNLIGEPEEFKLPDRFKPKRALFTKLKKKKFRIIKRNIYVEEKFNKTDQHHGIFCTCTLSPGSSTLCGSDCDCGTILSCCSSTCKCGSECNNKSFQQREIKEMKVVQTEKCGNGIVAEEDINPGEFIIEYVGEVIDKEMCDARLWELKEQEETNFYLCQINSNMVIDATYKGNISRYINHSCSPNTVMQKWMCDGETRIGIFAERYIKKGEELTYDYQFVPFGADQDCHCGAVCCRKKLGAKPVKSKNTPSDEAVKPPKVKKKRGRPRAG